MQRLNTLVLIVLLPLAGAACSVLPDAEDDPPAATEEFRLPHVEGSPPQEGDVVGTWRWIGATGGIVGHTVTPDAPGFSEQRLRFGADEAFALYRADTLALSGRYTLERRDGKAVLRYDVEVDHDIPGQRVEMAGRDTLILTDLCMDCYRSLYHRLR